MIFLFGLVIGALSVIVLEFVALGALLLVAGWKDGVTAYRQARHRSLDDAKPTTLYQRQPAAPVDIRRPRPH